MKPASLVALCVTAAACGGHASSAAPPQRPSADATDPVAQPAGPVAPTVAPSDALDDEAVGVELSYGVRVPMRDGVELHAIVYRPVAAEKPVPALLVKTPYMASSYHFEAMEFARHGFAVVLVDARGRGNSDGVFDAFQSDGLDGYDAVEWIAAQPWCNGKVGMFGGSYDGFGQWATVKHRPPHLATIVPTASVGFGIDFPMLNNVSYPYAARWAGYVSQRAPNWLFRDDDLWARIYRRAWEGRTTFRELDEFAGIPSAAFRNWVDHPTLDEFWLGVAPDAEEYAAMDVPILTITGHYDDDQPGAMHYYGAHRTHGSASARERHYLVMGPWDHTGTRRPSVEIGGLRFHPAAVVDLSALHLAWFDWTLRGGPKPEFLRSRVTYYVAEAGEWRYAESLGDVGAAARTLYLGSAGGADDALRSGVLLDAPGAGADRYRVDPNDPRLAEPDAGIGLDMPIVGREDAAPPTGTSLVYHTPPFAEATEVVGAPVLTAYLSMDVPDTDIWVRLYEVLPDGRTVFLTQDVMRARYRTSLAEATPVPSGEVLPYRFDRFTWFARRIRRGSRLRLVVGPPLGYSWQKNYQSGGVIADETPADARVGTITLHYGPEHTSTLELPVVAKP